MLSSSSLFSVVFSVICCSSFAVASAAPEPEPVGNRRGGFGEIQNQNNYNNNNNNNNNYQTDGDKLFNKFKLGVNTKQDFFAGLNLHVNVNKQGGGGGGFGSGSGIARPGGGGGFGDNQINHGNGDYHAQKQIEQLKSSLFRLSEETWEIRKVVKNMIGAIEDLQNTVYNNRQPGGGNKWG